MTQSEPVALPELPEITDDDMRWLSYNPNTADLVLWIQNYALRAIERTPAVALSDEQILKIASETLPRKVLYSVDFDAEDAIKFARALLARATERGQA